MRDLKLALPALLLLAFVLNAYCDGDAFREEDSLKASRQSGAASGTAEPGIPSSGISDPGSAGKAAYPVVEMPFFSQEEKEVPPLETEVYPEDESVNLTMTPEEAHDQYILDSRPKWYKRVPWGLCRGFVNLVTCPGELGRGFTYSFGEYHWALAAPAGLVAGIAGTLGRCAAGCADILTLGLFGDRDLAENFPDYVWQGQWDYGLYGQNKSAPAPEAAREEAAPKEDLGEGYIPSPTARTPLKARRAK
ncbi:hypothetical protein IKZ40_01745 [bacterium]|nr:hypothetical protein [bacterium]